MPQKYDPQKELQKLRSMSSGWYRAENPYTVVNAPGDTSRFKNPEEMVKYMDALARMKVASRPPKQSDFEIARSGLSPQAQVSADSVRVGLKAPARNALQGRSSKDSSQKTNNLKLLYEQFKEYGTPTVQKIGSNGQVTEVDNPNYDEENAKTLLRNINKLQSELGVEGELKPITAKPIPEDLPPEPTNAPFGPAWLSPEKHKEYNTRRIGYVRDLIKSAKSGNEEAHKKLNAMKSDGTLDELIKLEQGTQ
jgi:hypothetical protein